MSVKEKYYTCLHLTVCSTSNPVVNGHPKLAPTHGHAKTSAPKKLKPKSFLNTSKVSIHPFSESHLDQIMSITVHYNKLFLLSQFQKAMEYIFIMLELVYTASSV